MNIRFNIVLLLSITFLFGCRIFYKKNINNLNNNKSYANSMNYYFTVMDSNTYNKFLKPNSLKFGYSQCDDCGSLIYRDDSIVIYKTVNQKIIYDTINNPFK
jgi:hypothetical protein